MNAPRGLPKTSRLKAALPLQEESEKQLSLAEAQTKEALLALLPALSDLTHQVGGEAAPAGPFAHRECRWAQLAHFCCRITPSGCKKSKRKALSC